MRSKDQILLENIYSNINPTSNSDSFFEDESDKLNAIIDKFIKEYVARALKDNAVLAQLTFPKPENPEDYEDYIYQTVQDLIYIISKKSNIDTDYNFNNLTNEIMKELKDKDRHQHEEDEAERYERFRDSYS